MEEYRSGHNGADSKSDGRVKPAQEFDSPLFRLRLAVTRLRRDAVRLWNDVALAKSDSVVGLLLFKQQPKQESKMQKQP